MRVLLTGVGCPGAHALISNLKLQEFAGIMLEKIMAQGIRDGEVITREVKDEDDTEPKTYTIDG